MKHVKSFQLNFHDYLFSKPLFYDTIDYDRFPKAYKKISKFLVIPKIIHLVGTNGKGSTGRFLAQALYQANFKVGHYTSPHILKFNERIWLNNENVSDEELEYAHQKLQLILDQDSLDDLSYFEYTTLLALVCYQSCDYIVLEAGLGGEYDATNVFEKVLSIFTPIDYDHAAFLGSTLYSIATTKLRSMTKQALMSKQKHNEVLEIATTIAKEKNCLLKTVEDKDFEWIDEEISILGKINQLNHYLIENLKTAICAFSILGVKYKREYFQQIGLFGRLSKIANNILIDVGHNKLAAEAISKELKGKVVTLIYNTYEDKDYFEILKILSSRIKKVEIISVYEKRIVEKQLLIDALNQLNIEYEDFKHINEDEEYLVFGSFSVVETFLKSYFKAPVL